MDLVLKQIHLPKPNPDNLYVCYENQLQTRTIFVDSSQKAFFDMHADEILKDVIREITDYLSDDDACNDDVDMFPRRCEMTGEWYIGEINLDDEYLSVSARFLGHHPNPPLIDDYLELDVGFVFDESQNRFVFDGINSACI